MRMLFQLLCEDDEVVDIETSTHGKYQRPYNIEELKKYYPDKVDIIFLEFFNVVWSLIFAMSTLKNSRNIIPTK